MMDFIQYHLLNSSTNFWEYVRNKKLDNNEVENMYLGKKVINLRQPNCFLDILNQSVVIYFSNYVVKSNLALLNSHIL